MQNNPGSARGDFRMKIRAYLKHIVKDIGSPGPAMLGPGGTDFSPFCMTRLPLGQPGATQRMDCTADLLLAFV